MLKGGGIAPPAGLEPVDVVIPVHDGHTVLVRCLEGALAASAATRGELVVVDDASTEPETVRYLDSLAAGGRITLLRNETNRGFVASVNRGMALHPDRDVVLLNSDTEVAGDWLDRLQRAALAAADIGTVTPFSNNATICSFPVFCADNPLPPGVGVADLDAAFARANPGRSADLPTAVGFCMYIRRPCLAAVGAFDEQRFGRGYGEENDFCRRALAAGWRNVLAADVFVYHQGGASFKAEREELIRRAESVLRGLHPDYLDEVRAFVRCDPLADLRRAAAIELARVRLPAPVAAAGGGRPVQLHVLHDLGGGIARWCADYCRADQERGNLILKPVCRGTAFGEGLMLFDAAAPERPLRVWLFDSPIQATAASHQEYRRALGELLRDYRVDAVLVSSLIGHALDVLDTGLPTAVIAHDYFPVCPAINLHYDGVCSACDDARLADCHAHNPDYNPFADFPAAERLAVRRGFLERLAGGRIPYVVPSASVQAHLVTVAPSLATANFLTLAHGTDTRWRPLATRADHGRLRLVVLGMLSVSKGLRLLEAIADELVRFADIHLVGAQEVGELFRDRPGIHVLDRYAVTELPAILAGIGPDAGLLLSVWPETYSYTLTELQWLGIPPLATRLGGFAERIVDQETGFLVDPEPAALLARLQALAADRPALDRVRRNLAALSRRSAADMVADYQRLLPVTAGPGAWQTPAADGGLAARQVMTLAEQWKEIKSLRLRGAMKDLRAARLVEAAGRLQVERDARARQAETAAGEANRLQAQVAELHASTSWRVSAPVRWLGQALRRGRRSAPDVPVVPPPAVEAAEDWRQTAFRGYRQALEAAKPLLLARLAALPRRPLISVLVPAYNTPEPMLAAMLESLEAQWYERWELCIADDGSTLPHVRAMLERAAARDPRLRPVFGDGNRGVAHASNQALAMARGEFVVLLDHDDLLEPQALLRVAEAVVADDPDVLYGDEVLVGEDGETVQWYVFRPAFSPEYLRSHPYIVHLTGFRRRLLEELGGFDESLRISQDYDLILRACERAARIVHIPEILYRWRLHGGSAGHQRMQEVMATSRAVLGRHLERCGVSGSVVDGAAFNFFATRYPLAGDLRVAIIIPTRNRQDLVARCLESIETTAGDVPHDIFLVDHQSDDPAAQAYFASLGPRVKAVLRYAGPFNFSAINNWAVARVGGGHSHYLFCNNDVEALEPGWLGRMLELGQQPDVGIVGAKLYYGDRRTLQHVGVCVGAYGVAENLGRHWRLPADRLEAGYLGTLIVNHEVSAVTAACMLVQRRAFEELGGFAEALAVGYGDVDLCLRAWQAGYRVVLCAGAALLHHESQTRGPSTGASHPEDTARFLETWQAWLAQGDPYYNPNLMLDNTMWAIRVPLPFQPDPVRRIGRGFRTPGA